MQTTQNNSPKHHEVYKRHYCWISNLSFVFRTICNIWACFLHLDFGWNYPVLFYNLQGRHVLGDLHTARLYFPIVWMFFDFACFSLQFYLVYYLFSVVQCRFVLQNLIAFYYRTRGNKFIFTDHRILLNRGVHNCFHLPSCSVTLQTWKS